MDVFGIACAILAAAFPLVQGRLCYECNGVKSLDACHNVTSCDSSLDHCFMDVTGQPGDLTYRLGCRVPAFCQNNGNHVGCHECCNAPRCNRALCASVRSASNCDANCSDDPSFDCQQVDRVYGICHDIQNAKAVCRKFCGLCCLVDGAWSDWSSWGDCSATCGNGTIARRRTCDNPLPQNGGVDCQGVSLGLKQCSKQNCPTWSEWGNWTVCSASCGGGVAKRYRSCDILGQCQGDDIDFKVCNTNVCASGDGWSDWSSWGQCSQTCGTGMTVRQRSCLNPQPVCGGDAHEYKLCNTNTVCTSSPTTPIAAAWSEWGNWAVCRTSCGGGVSERHRSCDILGQCQGDDIDFKVCNTNVCASGDGLSDWSSWGQCHNRTCAIGVTVRRRSCSNPQPFCGGEAHEYKLCNTNAVCTSSPTTPIAAVDGMWGAWSGWSSCSATCGTGGTKTRLRTCSFDGNAPRGKDCAGSATDHASCDAHQPCPVDGMWGAWTEWLSCSATCGTGGTRTRHRTCHFDGNAPHGMPCAGSATDHASCDAHTICPVDGHFGPWQEWHYCSVTCGGGTRTRDRQCIFPPGVPHGADCLGQLSENESCGANACPVDGLFGPWTFWQSCSVTCGKGGTRTRHRQCIFPPNAPQGMNCTGLSNESESCDAGVCPVDGVWSSWKRWHPCTVTCGGGTRTRSRLCEFPPHVPQGGFCVGAARASEACNTTPCKFKSR